MSTETKETNLGEMDEGYFKQRKKSFEINSSELAEVAAFPRNALVELTNGCNHSCVFCKNSMQERRATNLDLKTYESFIKQAVSMGLKEVGLYSTGEPFMTKNLEDYIASAKQHGVSRVYITTNGALASPDRVISCYHAGLDSIKFSINASNAKDYALVHGKSDFDIVLNNVRDIYNWKSTTQANLQLLCTCVIIPALNDVESEHRNIFGEYFEEIRYLNSGSQCGQAFELQDQLGVSLNGVFGNLSIPVDPNEVKPCQMLWNRYHLTAEGYLTACCVDYELDLVFGNIRNETLQEAWNNELARALRKAHLEKKFHGLLCDQCLHNRPAPYKPLSEVYKKLKPEKVLQAQAKRLYKRIKITSV